MRLQWNMDTDVRSNVVPFDHRDVAIGPSAFQIKIVCTLPADVHLANMVLGGVN